MLGGVLQPHTYLMDGVVPERLWLFANVAGKDPYTDDRTTRLTLSLSREPMVRVIEGEGTSQRSDGRLTLELSNGAGSLSVELRY